MSESTYCALPWNHLATTSTGNLRVCCNSTPNINLIRKDDGSVYKIFGDIRKAWSSPTYKKIRSEMAQGIRPEMCKRCFAIEDSGMESPRQAWNKKWNHKNEKKINPSFDIKYLDLRLGNICNLKCRMCNPYSSNQWTNEWGLINKDIEPKDLKYLKNLNWPEKESTWKNLFLLAENIEEIYLTGGEPTIIKEQILFLDYLIENNLSGQIKLKYNTNLVKIPQNLINKWKYFKSVKVNCSVDAVGELNSYIRYPSSWEKIQNNINKLINIPNCTLEIHCTVQNYNLFYLSNLIEWSQSLNLNTYFNMLDRPNYLNIQSLTKDLKIKAKNYLLDIPNFQKAKGIIEYMELDDLSKNFNLFIKNSKIIDTSRSQSLLKHAPVFTRYFNH